MITAAPPGSTPALLQTLSSSTPVPIVSASATVLALPAGSVLSGTVVGRDAAGQVLVDTPEGQLALPASVALTTGTTLDLRLQGSSTNPQAQLVAVDRAAAAAVPRISDV